MYIFFRNKTYLLKRFAAASAALLRRSAFESGAVPVLSMPLDSDADPSALGSNCIVRAAALLLSARFALPFAMLSMRAARSCCFPSVVARLARSPWHFA